jgi:hypothetical protein
MQAQELVGNEAHKMQMAIILGPPRDLEDAGFEHRIGVVPHALRRQIQGGHHRLHRVIQGAQDAQVLDIGLNLCGLSGLREPFE